MYRITVNDAETYLVVMRNVFSPRLSIHKKYDLKVGTGHKVHIVETYMFNIKIVEGNKVYNSETCIDI